MDKYMELFEGLSIDEINAELAEIRKAATASKKVIRDNVKAVLKEEKAAAKAEADANAKDALKNVKEGDALMAIVKGEVVEVEFVKVNEKTFTAKVDGVKKGIRFDKLVLEATAVEADAV